MKIQRLRKSKVFLGFVIEIFHLQCENPVCISGKAKKHILPFFLPFLISLSELKLQALFHRVFSFTLFFFSTSVTQFFSRLVDPTVHSRFFPILPTHLFNKKKLSFSDLVFFLLFVPFFKNEYFFQIYSFFFSLQCFSAVFIHFPPYSFFYSFAVVIHIRVFLWLWGLLETKEDERTWEGWNISLKLFFFIFLHFRRWRPFDLNT